MTRTAMMLLAALLATPVVSHVLAQAGAGSGGATTGDLAGTWKTAEGANPSVEIVVERGNAVKSWQLGWRVDCPKKVGWVTQRVSPGGPPLMRVIPSGPPALPAGPLTLETVMTSTFHDSAALETPCWNAEAMIIVRFHADDAQHLSGWIALRTSPGDLQLKEWTASKGKEKEE